MSNVTEVMTWVHYAWFLIHQSNIQPVIISLRSVMVMMMMCTCACMHASVCVWVCVGGIGGWGGACVCESMGILFLVMLNQTCLVMRLLPLWLLWKHFTNVSLSCSLNVFMESMTQMANLCTPETHFLMTRHGHINWIFSLSPSQTLS